MKKLIILTVLIFGSISAIWADDSNSNTSDYQTTIKFLKKRKEDKTQRPQAPAYSPLYCILTDEDITVCCEYDAVGDITIVDSRTGVTIVSESGVDLGSGYTVYIPETQSEAPFTIYVSMNGSTYWADIY